MDPLPIPQAYRFVAVAVMLAEINNCAFRLGLDCELPISERSLQVEHVANPFITGFGGTFETKDFSFIFFKSGCLGTISRKHDSFRPFLPTSLQMGTITNSTEAYRLASNWLHAISIDVAKLEKKSPVSVRAVPVQLASESPHYTSETFSLQVLHVDWGKESSPSIRVAIFPQGKQLLAIYVDDQSFSTRPKELIKNMDALLAIPNEEFQHYSAADRAALIARFAAIDVLSGVFSDKGSLLLQKAPNDTGSEKRARHSLQSHSQ